MLTHNNFRLKEKEKQLPKAGAENANEERQNRWEKRLQAHAELLKARSEGGGGGGSMIRPNPNAQSTQLPSQSSSDKLPLTSAAKKRLRKRAATDNPGKASTLGAPERVVNKKRLSTGRLSLLRKKGTAPAPPGPPTDSSSPSSPTSSKKQLDDEQDEDVPTGFMRHISASLSIRTRKKKPGIEDVFGPSEGSPKETSTLVGEKADGPAPVEERKARRRSLGALMKRGSLMDLVRVAPHSEGGGVGQEGGDGEIEKEQRRNAFRTASAFFFKKPTASSPETTRKQQQAADEESNGNQIKRKSVSVEDEEKDREKQTDDDEKEENSNTNKDKDKKRYSKKESPREEHGEEEKQAQPNGTEKKKKKKKKNKNKKKKVPGNNNKEEEEGQQEATEESTTEADSNHKEETEQKDEAGTQSTQKRKKSKATVDEEAQQDGKIDERDSTEGIPAHKKTKSKKQKAKDNP